MPRKAKGELTERVTSRGRSWGCRFSTGGKRFHTVLSREWEGGSEEHALAEMDFLIRRVNGGYWSEDELRRTRAKASPAEEPEVELPEFREFASRWLADRELARGGEELEDVRWLLESHLLPFFTGRRLDEIGVEDVDTFTRYKLAEKARYAEAKTARERRMGLAPGSINKAVSVLAAILETAVEYGHIARNAASGKRRKLPAPKPSRSYINRAEPIAALLDAASEIDREKADAEKPSLPYRRALLAVLVYAGPRISEAEEIRRRDVDLAEGRLRIRGTKSDAADRVVDLLPALYDDLASLFAADPDADPSDRVFRTSKGGRIGATNVRKRVLAPAIEAADETLREAGDEPFPEGITPHSLRRTFASILVALGKDPSYVMNQMGHATPDFTLGVYTGMMKASEEDRERLRRLVEGRPLDGDEEAPDRGDRPSQNGRPTEEAERRRPRP